MSEAGEPGDMVLDRVYTGADVATPPQRDADSARRQDEMRIFEQADCVPERIVHGRDLDPFADLLHRHRDGRTAIREGFHRGADFAHPPVRDTATRPR